MKSEKLKKAKGAKEKREAGRACGDVWNGHGGDCRAIKIRLYNEEGALLPLRRCGGRVQNDLQLLMINFKPKKSHANHVMFI